MSSHAAFLSEIRAAPDDDAPRLVYADWLDDSGDPDRAEFIRLQCRLDSLPRHDPARFDLEERSQDLLAEHRGQWLARLPKWALAEEIGFRRGMPETANLTAAIYARHGDRLAQLIPLRSVKLTNLWGDAARAAGLPATATLTELDLDRLPGDEARIRDCFAAITTDRLRVLSVFSYSQNPGLPEVLAQWPPLARLTALHVRATRSDDRWAAVFALRHIGQLRRLTLANLDLGPADCRALARAERLRDLESLDVSDNSLRDGGAAALAGADWPNLREFRASPWRMADDELWGLLSARWLSGLRSLAVSRVQPSQPLAPVVAALNVPHLAALELDGVGLGDEGVRTLAASALLSTLTSLNLSTNGCGETAARALADSPHLNRLVRLDLHTNPIAAAGICAVVDSPKLAALAELKLGANNFGPQGERLAATDGLGRLRELGLANSNFPAGAIAVLAGRKFDRLARLDLSFNRFGDDGVRALLAVRWLPSLRELYLTSNRVGDGAVRALAGCAGLSRLRVLNLSHNFEIEDAGADALADSPHLGRLLRLALPNGRISRPARDRLRDRFGSAVEFLP